MRLLDNRLKIAAMAGDRKPHQRDYKLKVSGTVPRRKRNVTQPNTAAASSQR